MSRYVRLLRHGSVPAPPPPALPKLRRALRWVMTHSENLRPEQAIGCKKVRAACPELDATVDHVRAFAALMNEHRGEDLNTWIDHVKQHDLHSLRQFADGCRGSGSRVQVGTGSCVHLVVRQATLEASSRAA
ncbi:hypothetical protein AB0884_38705, partial [Streptomyces sp. NPDC005283]